MTIKSFICAVPDCDNPRDKKQCSSLCVMHRVRRSRHKSHNLPTKPNEFDESFSFEKINRGNAGKGKVCSITNCETKVYKHGTICSKHRSRFKKFNSYDLPGYKGEPNIPILPPKLPNGIIKICSVHGKLTSEQAYARTYKGRINSYNCKQCVLDLNMKKNFGGITYEDYQRMLIAQNNACAICKKQETITLNKKIKRLSIDHCHKSQSDGIMKIRGLLCAFCNSALGYFNDSIEHLQAAIEYLRANER